MGIMGKIVRKVSGSADIVRAALKGSDRVESLDVFGAQEFRHAVARALLLLRDNRLPAWNTVMQYVDAIVEGHKTTIIIGAHPAMVFIHGPDWRQGAEVLAATIAFMACGCQLHRTFEAEFPGRRVPRDIYAGNAARERCDEAYQECLRALGRPPGQPGSRKDSYLR
jgi:glycerol-3-phosphate cytidylyltransferase-like family protein